MSTPDYYKYDGRRNTLRMLRYKPLHSVDWAQVIQYVFRWQKKGGVEDLEKALVCAKDARDNGITPKPITKSHILRRTIKRKLIILSKQDFSNAHKVWEGIIMRCDATDEIIAALEEMIRDAKNVG